MFDLSTLERGGNPDYVPDPARTARMVDTFLKIRINLLVKHPFWGQLVIGLDMVDATTWCDTFACDGRRYYYNIEFFESLDREEIKWAFSHSLYTLVFDHMMRQGAKLDEFWDPASDYSVNRELKKEEIGKAIEGHLYDSKFDSMTVEEIYEELKKNPPPTEQLKSIDMHMKPGTGDDDGSDNKQSDENGNYYSMSKPNVSESEMKQIREEFKNACLTASQTAGMQSVPEAFRDMIRDMTDPVLDWRDYLPQTINASFKDDYSWLRPNRRLLSSGTVMPGMDYADTIKVHCTIDKSGSMSINMLEDLLSEIYGIMTTYADFEVHVWQFDTSVSHYKVFTPANIEEMKSYPLTEGGGTDFMCNWEFMKEREIEPDTLIVFTDGLPCGDWGIPGYCDTIYLVHSDPQHRNKAPMDCGMTLWYETEK